MPFEMLVEGWQDFLDELQLLSAHSLDNEPFIVGEEEERARST
jgi:hypothetical protein